MNTKRVTAAGIIAAGKNEKKKKMLPGKDLLLLNLWNCAEREKKREEEEEMEEERESEEDAAAPQRAQTHQTRGPHQYTLVQISVVPFVCNCKTHQYTAVHIRFENCF